MCAFKGFFWLILRLHFSCNCDNLCSIKNYTIKVHKIIKYYKTKLLEYKGKGLATVCFIVRRFLLFTMNDVQCLLKYYWVKLYIRYKLFPKFKFSLYISLLHLVAPLLLEFKNMIKIPCFICVDDFVTNCSNLFYPLLQHCIIIKLSNENLL